MNFVLVIVYWFIRFYIVKWILYIMGVLIFVDLFMIFELNLDWEILVLSMVE